MKRFNLIIMLLFIQLVGFAGNRFTTLFDKADSTFNKEYHLNVEALRRASKEAAKEADEKTKHLKPKIPTIRDLIGDSLIYEFDKIHELFNKKEDERKTNRRTIGADDLYYH